MKCNFCTKCICYCSIIISLFLTACLTNVYSQNRSEIILSNGKHTIIENSMTGFSAVEIVDGKDISVHKENPEEVIRIIVILKDQPLTVYQNKKLSLQKLSLTSVFAELQSAHRSLKAALNNINQRLSIQSKSDFSFTIKHDYYRALNGVAMECKRGMINKIRALPMVKYVSIDNEVKAQLTKSIHQIRADIVQDSLGFTGEGVLVGNIDTGIDYNNPVLGGGFGSSYRVIGGYDFSNNDSDPMDDNGHGTHVAGIIGANGDSLRGVAPGVKFLAVKVLNSEGNGFISDVIAGIEYCLDPDGNPDTDDAADIVNMSLGGNNISNTETPLDSAVNNATNTGMLSVAAAGNRGVWGYATISSPGTSKSALTVGACDLSYNIASFSSAGPDLVHNSIKPEVVAPGVNIFSTVLNNHVSPKSGTSMATPHVTGIAALLKQQHPNWTPEELKASIINSAHSVGDAVSPFLQGKGCVDALDAASLGLVIEPGVINFGMVDLKVTDWKDTVKLTVRNYRSVSQNSQVSIMDGYPAGVTITFDKTFFSLAPGEETTIEAVLTVPSSVPVVREEPFSYFGKIQVISDSDKVFVPFCFFKSSILVVNLDLPATMLTLIDRTKKKITTNWKIGEGQKNFSFNITQGDSLEILALMQKDTLDVTNYYLVNQTIEKPIGLTYAFVGHNEAAINVTDTIYDIHNNLVTGDTLSGFKLNLTKWDWGKDVVGDKSLVEWNLGFPFNSQIFVSPLGLSFLIDKSIIITQEKELFLLRKSTRGLHNRKDIAIDSGPDNLIGYHINSSYVDPYLEDTNIKPQTIIGSRKFTLALTPISWTTSCANSFLYREYISKIYINKYYINGNLDNKYFFSSLFMGMGYWGSDYGSLFTPDFILNEKGEAVFGQKGIKGLEPWSLMGGEISTAYIYEIMKPGDTIKVEQNAHINLPDHMSYIRNGWLFIKCNNDWLNQESYGGIKQSNGVTEYRNYFGKYYMTPSFSAQVFAKNRIQNNIKTSREIQSGPYYDLNGAYYAFDETNINSGTLRLLSTALPYKIIGQTGLSISDFEYQKQENLTDQYAEWSVNLLGASIVFPSFSLLQVSVDDKASDIVRPGQDGKIRLILFDHYKSTTSVKISLLLASGDEISLPVTNIGENEYNAPIPNYIPEGFIDIVARVEDAKGNKSELTISPGFYFGSSVDNISFDSRIRMLTYSLDNVETVQFEEGDTLNYTLSFVNYGNVTARNVLVQLPVTPYFSPVGSQSITIDSIAITDTIKIPVSLVFQGKQQTNDEQAYYSPGISWTSNGTNYMRNAKVLVDFQNTVTGVTQMKSTIPIQYELYQNYPNPFNPSTTIKYDLPKESHVSLIVYNILGQQVETLVDDMKPAGRYEVSWNGSMSKKLASGVYLLSISAGNFNKTIKMLLLK